MFTPHRNLGDEVNRNIIQSEIEGGVFLEGLPPDTILQIRTQHHDYTAQLLGKGAALISGHPQYCPQPVQVTITGSGLTGTTKVTFGGVKATSYTVNSGTQITATVPTGAKTGKVAVTTPGGSASSKSTFTVTP